MAKQIYFDSEVVHELNRTLQVSYLAHFSNKGLLTGGLIVENGKIVGREEEE